MRRSDILPPFPPRFVVLRLAVPLRAPVFVSPHGPTPTARPGAFGSGSPTPVGYGLETAGPPKFLGNPHVPMPCSPTPAGPTHQALRCAGAVPALEPRR